MSKCNDFKDINSFSVERYLTKCTLKHILFARTLFSHKSARASARENKVLANNFSYKVSQITKIRPREYMQGCCLAKIMSRKK